MKPRIWVFTPHCHSWEGEPRGCDLGLAYNKYMALIPDDDWAVLMDSDAMPCTRGWWFKICEEAIEKIPEAGAFVGVTNRLIRQKSGWQMTSEAEMDHDNDNMLDHWRTGWVRAHKHSATIQDVTDIDLHSDYGRMSGVFMLISKRVWDQIGGAIHGMFMVDWTLHERIREAGYRVYLLPGVYVYHWYRHYQEYSKGPYGL